MNGLLGTFCLENFDAFFNDYKSRNTLAHEALMALDHFLQALNMFFDLDDNLTKIWLIKIMKFIGIVTLMFQIGITLEQKACIIMNWHLVMYQSI